MKQKTLYWLHLYLPVLLFPLANLITAAVTHSSIVKAYITPNILPPFLPAAVIFILGAVLEELLYRWFLLKKLFFETTKLRPILSILIVSVLFAGMHLWNLQASQTVLPVLQQVLFAFCFSVWAGAVVWQTDRIWIPLLAHMLLNATAGDVEIAWINILLSIALLADGVVLLKGRREKKCHDLPNLQHPHDSRLRPGKG